jgi:SRSO17 transposase
MISAWARRPEAWCSDGVGSAHVFDHLVDRLCDVAAPDQHGLETEAGQRQVQLYLAGVRSHFHRQKAAEIAAVVEVARLVIQACMGTAPWEHRPLIPVVVGQVVERWGAPDGVLACDPRSFPTRGTQAGGVTRQWCGHRGTVDTCQVGVSRGYGSRHDHAGLDCRRYRPQDWAWDQPRRQACQVPEDVPYGPRQAPCWARLDLGGEQVPHGWVVGDAARGRDTWCRQQGRARGARDGRGVPCTTTRRDLAAPVPVYQGRGRRPTAPGPSVTAWRP